MGPTDKVVIVVDSRTEDAGSDDDLHSLTFRAYTCSNNDDCATPSPLLPLSPSDTLRFGKMFRPSVGIRHPAGGPTNFHVVAKAKIETDCDQDTTHCDELDDTESADADALGLDLMERHATAGSSIGLTATYTVETNDDSVPCRNHEESYTKTLAGDPWSCWVEAAITTTPASWIECGSRTTAWSTYFVEDAVGVPYTDPLFDGPWFDFRDDEPVVAFHDAIDATTEVHFPYEVGDPQVDFPALADDTRTPSIHITAAGQVRLAWADRDDTLTDTIEYSSCATTDHVIPLTPGEPPTGDALVFHGVGEIAMDLDGDGIPDLMDLQPGPDDAGYISIWYGADLTCSLPSNRGVEGVIRGPVALPRAVSHQPLAVSEQGEERAALADR